MKKKKKKMTTKIIDPETDFTSQAKKFDIESIGNPEDPENFQITDTKTDKVYTIKADALKGGDYHKIIQASDGTIPEDDIKKYYDIVMNMDWQDGWYSSEKMKNDCNMINDFLHTNVYNHKKLQQKRLQVEQITEKLFKYFLKNFKKLPKDWFIQEKNEDKHRIICDYISGMTDRYAFKLYQSLYE